METRNVASNKINQNIYGPPKVYDSHVIYLPKNLFRHHLCLIAKICL